MQLHHRAKDLAASGARIVVIGNGAPMFIAGFRETTGYEGPIYTDPSLAVFAAAGLVRSMRATLSLRAAVRSVGALGRGARQGRTQGDAWQQGGVVVIKPGGDVVWTHASSGPGDNASADEILRALAAA